MKRRYGLRIARRRVFGPPPVPQGDMFRTDGRIVEPRRHRVGRRDLALAVLKQEGLGSVENSHGATGETRRMFTQGRPGAAGLDPNQTDSRIA